MTAAIYTALRLERAALWGTPAYPLTVCTGMGPRHALAASRGRSGPAIVTGLAGGLAVGLNPGDVVVASEVHGGDATIAVPCASLLADAVRALGLCVRVGPIICVPRVVHGAARARLARTGALAVDLESAWLAPTAAAFAVVRVVVDTAENPLWSLGVLARGVRALTVLRRLAPVLAQWATTNGAWQAHGHRLTDPGPATVSEGDEKSDVCWG